MLSWLPHESGEFERIRPHLTPLRFVIIAQGHPVGDISEKVGLIWGIPGNIVMPSPHHGNVL